MKNVLVTGASGQLGSCIKDLSSGYSKFNFIFTNSSELDISSKEALTSFFQNKKIHYCINCAAYTAVDKAESEMESAAAINFTGAKNLAEACKEFAAILIHISTDFVFDGQSEIAYTEKDPTGPINLYGKTKLEGEKAIQHILEQHFIIRTSWLYSEYGNNFMKSMIKLGSERSELGVVADQVGTPTYAKDLSNFLLFLISENRTEFGVYHYSNLGKTSWYGFAKRIFEIKKIEVNLKPITTSEYPTPANRPKFSLLDKNKVVNTFKINIPHWEDSLETAISNLDKLQGNSK